MNALLVPNPNTLRAQAFDVAAEHLAWEMDQGMEPDVICRDLGFQYGHVTQSELFAAICTIWVTDRLMGAG